LALKIGTFWGPEMATSETSAIWAHKSRDFQGPPRPIARVIDLTHFKIIMSKPHIKIFFPLLAGSLGTGLLGRPPRPPGSGRPQRGQKHPRRCQGGSEDLWRLGPSLPSRIEYLPQSFLCNKPVLRIHDILVRIRIRGSMRLTNGSGSATQQQAFGTVL
jgi:hypothetical protein